MQSTWLPASPSPRSREAAAPAGPGGEPSPLPARPAGAGPPPLPAPPGPLGSLDPLAAARGVLEHRTDRAPGLELQLAEGVEPLLDGGQPLGVGLRRLEP